MIKTAKISLAALLTVLFAFSANAVEIRVGVSAGFAQLEASGQETLKDSSNVTKATEQANAIIPSIFAELTADNGLGLGYDMIAGSADLTGSTKTRNLQRHDDTGTNKANAEVDGVTTLYLIKMFEKGLYVKAGLSSADVNTKETLGSGSTYKNISVDGKHFGIGMERVSDGGLFLRAGLEHTDFDTLNLTGSQSGASSTSFNKIKADIDMTAAKLSVGKRF